MGELRRSVRPIRCLMIGIAVVLNLFLFAYHILDGGSMAIFRESREQYQFLTHYYGEKSLADAVEDVKQKVYEGELKEYYAQLSDSGKAVLETEYKQLRAKLKYLNGYEDGVRVTIQSAENMQKHSLFNKKGTFSYNNIIQTAKDFDNVKDVQVSLVEDRGVDVFLNYKIMYYIAGALMLFYIYDLLSERENGMWSIIHDTLKGRGKLALVRSGCIILQAFLITLGVYATTFLEAMLFLGGWENLSSPIQTISSYAKYTHADSQIGYVFKLFVLYWFVLSCIGIILWAALIMMRNRNYTVVFIGAVVGVEILLYNKIGIQSNYNVFHYINIVSLLNINELCRGYVNWGIGSFVVSVYGLLRLVLVGITLIAIAVALVQSIRLRPEQKLTFIGKMITKLSEIYQRTFAKTGVMLKEIHKLIFTAKGFIFILIIIFISVFCCMNSRIKLNDSQKTRDAFYLEHGGEDYSYVTNQIAEARQNLNDANETFAIKGEQYKNGLISLEEYVKEMNVVKYCQGVMEQNKEYENKVLYLNEMKEQYGTEGWLISDRSYELVLGKTSKQRENIILIVLIAGIMLLVSECGMIEKSSGMDKLINASAKGKKWVERRKLIVSLLLSIGLFLFVYVVNYICLKNHNGFYYLDAPLVSFSYVKEYAGIGVFTIESLYKLLISCSIRQIIWLRLGIRFVFVLLSMGISFLVSNIRIGERKKNRVFSLIVMLMWILFVYLVINWIGFL